MKEKTFLLGTLIFIISISAVSGNNENFYNFSFNSDNNIIHTDIKDNDVVYFTQNGNVYRADMNSNKSVLLDSLGSRISQITSSGHMISIRTEDRKLYVFNHDERVIYKFAAHEGELQKVIIDDTGYLAVITLKDIALGTREWVGYVYSPSGDLIAQNRSSSVLTSFVSLNDKLVFGAGSGNVSVYDSTGSTKLWVNNIGSRIMGFQHYGDDVLLASEKSIYSLSYVDSPKLSKILSIDDYPNILVSGGNRFAISSIEGCLYVLSDNSLQNQFSFDGANVIGSCQQNDKIKDVHLLDDKTLVLTETGRIFIIQGGENKLTITYPSSNNFKVSGYTDDGKLYIVSQSSYKLDVYNFDNIKDLEKEINDAKSSYAAFLEKIKEENVPTFEGEEMLNDIERNYSAALSYWDAGNYTASKDYLDDYNSGIKEYFGEKETKSTNLFSIILIAAVLILAVVAILFSMRKKGVSCPNCGYALRDYWSNCPKCGQRLRGR